MKRRGNKKKMIGKKDKRVRRERESRENRKKMKKESSPKKGREVKMKGTGGKKERKKEGG